MDGTQTPPPAPQPYDNGAGTPPPPIAPTPTGHEKNTLMAILAYIGPLIIVSYLTAKDDSFVKFHIRQGLLLFIPWVIIWLLGSAVWHVWGLINLINAAIVILAIIGTVNAANGEEKELPLIGHLAHNFKF